MPDQALDNVLADARLLVVDDEASNARLLVRLLERAGCPHVDVAGEGETALALFQAHRHDVVLLDLHMPRHDGFDFLTALREALGEEGVVPVIVVSADGTAPSRRRAHELGAADFVVKPYMGADLVMRVERLLEFIRWQRRTSADAVRQRRRADLAEDEIIARLEEATRLHDGPTRGHTERVAALSAGIARRLGMSAAAVRRIARAAPLHDLGKIAVSDAVLQKQGSLTDDQLENVRQHTVVGAAILAGSRFPVLRMAESIALTHHERWDGTGYPRGLRGEEIPLEGRIVAVADVFDALTHVRPYKAAWSRKRALAEITAQRGRQFDPRIVDVLLELAGQEELVPAAAESAVREAKVERETHTTVFHPARPQPGFVGNIFRRPSVA
ncbi:MAG: HD domain-containing phosphohydrolase [Gemmatimonadota bacterium]